jgi:hypothetical protein
VLPVMVEVHVTPYIAKINESKTCPVAFLDTIKMEKESTGGRGRPKQLLELMVKITKIIKCT